MTLLGYLLEVFVSMLRCFIDERTANGSFLVPFSIDTKTFKASAIVLKKSCQVAFYYHTFVCPAEGEKFGSIFKFIKFAGNPTYTKRVRGSPSGCFKKITPKYTIGSIG